MTGEKKTKETLLHELSLAHQRIAELEAMQCHEQEYENHPDFYQTSFAKSPLGIIVTNTDFRIIEANSKACEMLGYSKAEFKHLSPFDVSFPDDIDKSEKLLKGLFRGDYSSYQLEKRYIRKDGSILWIMLTVAIVRDTAGQALYSIGMIEDINERKEAQEQLLASEKRYRDLVDNIQVGIISSTPDGEVLYVNDALLQMLEYDSLEDYKSNGVLAKYKNPEDRRVLIEILKKCGKVWGYELEVLSKHGKVLTILLNSTFDGKVMTQIAVDITQRKQAEESLQEERNLLTTIINNLPVDIFVKDLKSRFVLANKATMKTLGVTKAEEYLGKDDYDFNPHKPDEARENMALERHITDTGEAMINRELHGIGDDGRPLWNLSSKIPLRDSQGEIVGIVGIGMDITDKKLADEAIRAALEKEQQTNALKDRFMAMVSHEFRTPLTIIATSNQILKNYFEQISTEKRVEHLKRIEGQITHLNNMLENISMIMRSDVDPLSLNPDMLDVEELCRTVLETLQTSIGVEHLFKFSAQADLKMISADAALLRIVLTNLLSNAIKYSPTHSEICLELFQEDEHQIIKIHDHGIGIAPEDMKRLFEPYHRGENTSNIKGLGLGLKIVKDFVELHGGSVSVKSAVGEGTSFIVSLPFEPPHPALIERLDKT